MRHSAAYGTHLEEHHPFAKKYFQADILDSSHYHLVINTAFVKLDTIAGIMKEVLRDKS